MPEAQVNSLLAALMPAGPEGRKPTLKLEEFREADQAFQVKQSNRLDDGRVKSGPLSSEASATARGSTSTA